MCLAIRYGANVNGGDLFASLGLAIAGNLVGGLVLVTLARSAQAFAASSS